MNKPSDKMVTYVTVDDYQALYVGKRLVLQASQLHAGDVLNALEDAGFLDWMAITSDTDAIQGVGGFPYNLDDVP